MTFSERIYLQRGAVWAWVEKLHVLVYDPKSHLQQPGRGAAVVSICQELCPRFPRGWREPSHWTTTGCVPGTSAESWDSNQWLQGLAGCAVTLAPRSTHVTALLHFLCHLTSRSLLPTLILPHSVSTVLPFLPCPLLLCNIPTGDQVSLKCD